MTRPRILMTAGIALMAVAATIGCSRNNEVAPQSLVNPAIEPGTRRLPMAFTRSPVIVEARRTNYRAASLAADRRA